MTIVVGASVVLIVFKVGFQGLSQFDASDFDHKIRLSEQLKATVIQAKGLHLGL